MNRSFGPTQSQTHAPKPYKHRFTINEGQGQSPFMQKTSPISSGESPLFQPGTNPVRNAFNPPYATDFNKVYHTEARNTYTAVDFSRQQSIERESSDPFDPERKSGSYQSMRNDQRQYMSIDQMQA